MVIYATSDLHGHLPEIPECDLLLVGGDLCPVHDSHAPDVQRNWLDKAFRHWLEDVPAKQVVGIAGNHDFVFEKSPKAVADLELPWTYLQDQITHVGDVSIYGTPWVPNLPSWAFHGGTNGRVSWEKWEGIPEGIDILLSHGPMRGFGDYIDDRYGHVGCVNMRDAVRLRQPKAFVCGHIHEGYGFYHHPYIEHGVYNVAHMDAGYEPVNPVVELHGLRY